MILAFSFVQETTGIVFRRLYEKTGCPKRYRSRLFFLINLTPMKILQRNWNRSTFVMWEMKRNVSVVCVCSAPNCKIIKEMPGLVASGTHCILHITYKRPQDIISFWKEFKCSCCIYLFICMLNSWHYGSDNIPVLVQHWLIHYIVSETLNKTYCN
jgi:hypothetical protein